MPTIAELIQKTEG